MKANQVKHMNKRSIGKSETCYYLTIAYILLHNLDFQFSDFLWGNFGNV